MANSGSAASTRSSGAWGVRPLQLRAIAGPVSVDLKAESSFTILAGSLDKKLKIETLDDTYDADTEPRI